MTDEAYKSFLPEVYKEKNAIVLFQKNPLLIRLSKDSLNYATEIARSDEFEAKPFFEAGERHFKNCDYDGAVRWFLSAAHLGHLKAQLRLGGIFLEGHGDRLDYNAALRWFLRASDQGDSLAQYKIGWMHEAGLGVPVDQRKAVYWYRTAAEAGNPDAQFSIGVKYDNGEGVEHNPTEAVRWFLMSAEQGYNDARYFLAQALENGEGIDRNIDEAIDWYFLAAESGHTSSARKFWSHCLSGAFIPSCYEEALTAELIGKQLGNNSPRFADYLGGNVDEFDEFYERLFSAISGKVEDQFSLGLEYSETQLLYRQDAAVFWYQKAARRGNAASLNNLGVIFSRQGSPFFNPVEATNCYEKAHNLGSIVGTFNYANRLLNGAGTRKNVKRGLKLLQDAANKGYLNAMVSLAEIYYDGALTNVDYSRALAWYEKAKAEGDAAGFFGVGLILGQGLGVPKDINTAYNLMTEAAKKSKLYSARLYRFLSEGRIFEKNLTEADKWKVREPRSEQQPSYSDNSTLLSPTANNTRAQRLEEKRGKERIIRTLFD